jgi:hypothetical protein
MAVSKPLLLLDNASMLALLHQGCFRLQEISFEEEYGQLLEENGFDPHQTSVPASSTVHFSANTHPKNGIK